MRAEMHTPEPLIVGPDERWIASTAIGDERTFGTLVSLRSVKTGIWRRRRVWLITALIGMIVGGSLHFVIPRKYAASIDVYLVHPATADAIQAIANDVSLLQTPAVAQQAIDARHLHTTSTALLTQYHGFSLSVAVMSITFNGASPRDAIASANVIASAFLAVRADEAHLQTATLIRGLQSQITSLNGVIGKLNNAIDNLSSGSTGTTANQLTSLVTQRDNDAGQVSQLQADIQQNLLNLQTVEGDSHVLSSAEVVPVSIKKAILKDVLAGLVAGLAVGLGVVILGLLLSDRPRDRASVATAMGAPVELSLGRVPRPRFMRKYRLSRRFRKPHAAIGMIERRLRSQLELAAGSSLGIVTVGASDVAALAVGALAVSLSSDGHRVAVVDAADGRPLASLFDVKVNGTRTTRVVKHSKGSFMLIIGPGDPAEMAQKVPPEDADVVLVLATLDPSFGAAYLESWIADAVVLLTAGRVHRMRIRVTGEMLRDQGIAVRSVILLGADSWDESSGGIVPTRVRVNPVHVAEAGQPIQW